MKKIILMLLLAAPLCAFAQVKNITSLYNTYSQKKGVTCMMMSSDMVASKLGVADVASTGRLMVISAERSLSFFSSDIRILRDQVMQIVSAPGYKLLMEARDDDETVRVYGKEASPMLRDVLILVVEDDEITVVGIDGDIPSAQLKNLAHIANDD